MKKQRIAILRFFIMTLVIGALCSMPAFSVAATSNVDGRINKLEQRIEQLQKRVQQPREIDWKTIEKRLEQLERKQPVAQGGETGNMVTFRGGFVGASSDRANEVFTDVFGFTGNNAGDNGFYVGGALLPRMCGA